MPTNLNNILTAILADPGLRANINGGDITEGSAGVSAMNRILLQMISNTNVNADGLITLSDMHRISVETRANPDDYITFVESHGRDNGSFDSGFHNFQNDGGTLVFQGRDFINTVADTIFFFGYRIEDGVYYNLDGRSAKEAAEGAGWLNYFLNGENMVYGTGASDELGSGEYSAYFATARNETFMAGDGNDSVWADIGNDKVYGGTGADRVGAGFGGDRVFGEAGNDTLWGERGADAMFGGTGTDILGGGDDNDRLYGGDMGDSVYGEDGNDLVDGGLHGDVLDGQAGTDTLYGGQGHDNLGGGDGADRLIGGTDDDTLGGGNGTDSLRGGTGADDLILWEDARARDTLIFAMGDSGKTLATMDEVMGFDIGSDKIDLTAFGAMTFQALDYTAGGRASCYFDGRYLRIDATGDGRTDMIVGFGNMDDLRVSDFIFA